LSEQDAGASDDKGGSTADNEFRSALREATAAKAGGEVKNSPDPAGADKGDAAPAKKDDADAGKAAEGADSKASAADNAGGKPDDKAGAEAAAGKQPEKSPKPADIVVDWSKVDPALKAAYDAGTPETKKALEAVVKKGLRAGQQVAQLKNTLSNTKRKAPPASTSRRPLRSGTDLKKHLEGPSMKALEKEAPEITAALKEVTAPLIAELENANKDLDAQARAEIVAEAEGEEAILAEHHPDWEKVTESDDFGKWLQTAPPYVKAMVARNAQRSELFPNGRILDGQEAAHVLTLFKQSMDVDTAGDEPPSALAAGSHQPSPVDTKRQLQREGARQPDVKGIGGAQTGVAEDDFAGALRQATREKNAERLKRSA